MQLMETDLTSIVSRLSRAQRHVLMWLPPDGSTKVATGSDYSAGQGARWLCKAGLAEEQAGHQPKLWRLTPLGQRAQVVLTYRNEGRQTAQAAV